MRRILTGLGASALLVVVLMGLIVLLPDPPGREIDGATLFRAAAFCPLEGETCSAAPLAVPLPHRVRSPVQEGIHRARFSVDFDRFGDKDGITAIYLPEFSDAVSISVNGWRQTPDPWAPGAERAFHHWHRPFIAMVSNALLEPQGNRLTIDLAAQVYQGISLSPLYTGDAAALDLAYQQQFIVRVGMARINLSLVGLAGGALLLFWLIHYRDPAYLWLGLASLASAAVCYHWVYPNVIANYRHWITFWNTAAALQVWCLLSFVCTRLHAGLPRLRLGSLIAIAGGTVGLTLLPTTLFSPGIAAYQLGFLALALVMLTVLVGWRHGTRPLNFAVLFGLYGLAATLALSQWIARHLWVDWAPTLLASIIPVVFVLSVLWVVFYELGRSISRYEDLTASLQSTIDEKTAELQMSYERLAAQSKLQAVDEERQRILLDLHDGIGGQLVNMLAYMSTQAGTDSVLETAIEDALRDMGLMIDSLEAGDSIATQLGLLRGRLEPLFRAHRVDLVWRIRAEPGLPGSGPSQNLTLLRIVQEAITNAVRHAQARTITITATERSISVADDGHGFDPEEVGRRGRHGIGLTGMKRRARALGVTLDIASSPAGTRVDLSWSA